MGRRDVRRCSLAFLAMLGVELLIAGLAVAAEPEKIVQAGMNFTVAESKRLIGKAVAQMPIVKNALENGTIIIIKGTTTRYAAEEITGQKIVPAEYVTGRLMPKQPELLPKGKSINNVVLEKGKLLDIPLPDAVKKLNPGIFEPTPV